MSIVVEVSVGELLDKLTILQIKADRIRDPDKLHNIRRELQAVQATWAAAPQAGDDGLQPLIADLRRVNEDLWDIEDAIRAKEAAGEFDQPFIDLARAVYRTNDRRAAIKKALNQKTGSDLVEEKSYTDYPHAE